MIRIVRNFRKLILPRYFSEDFVLEESEEELAKGPELGPETVRVLPVPKHPLFAKHYVRFKLTPEHFKFMLADEHSNYVGAFVLQPKQEANELESQFTINTILPVKDFERLYQVGSYCQTSFNKFDRTITLKPLHRTRLLEVSETNNSEDPFPLAKVVHFDETTPTLFEDTQSIMKILVQELEELRLLLSGPELTTLEIFAQRYNMRYDQDLLNYVGVVLSYMCDTAKIQRIFEPESFEERLQRTTELVQEHVQLRRSMKNLQNEAQAKMSKASEEHTYKEILTLVKNKLGLDKDDKEMLRTKYTENLKGKTVPEHIQKLIDEEMERLMMTDKNNSEFHVIRTYLD